MELSAYVISLSSRTDRRRRMSVSLNNRGISYKFYDAVESCCVSRDFSDINFSSYVPLSKRACFLSHYSVLLMARRLDMSGILVMEDDVYTMCIDARDKLLDGILNLPSRSFIVNFEYILHGGSLRVYDGRYYISDSGKIWGLGCYYMTRLGIDYYLDLVFRNKRLFDYKGADVYVDRYLYGKGRSYIYRPKVCYQDLGSWSSIPGNRVTLLDRLGENVIINTQHNFIYSGYGKA